MTRPLIIFHAGCFDGFCAAWIMRRKWRDAEFIAANYGDDPPKNITGRDVYILDFSYPRAVLDEMAMNTSRLTILDHHQTAAKDLDGFGHTEQTKVRCIFDMMKSGARLTWEFFHNADEKVPGLVDYTEDRDLWRWALRGSKAVNAFLRSYPFDFDRWDEWGQWNAYELYLRTVDAGEAILRCQQSIIDQHIRFAREREMHGHKVLVVNATCFTSEITGELAKGRPFAASYFDRADGKRVWSLRSTEDGIDVSEIAKRHGGGGHKHAAGFEEGLTPLHWLLDKRPEK